MSDIELGTVRAFVVLDISGLMTGAEEANAAIREMAASIETAIGEMTAEVTAEISEMSKGIEMEIRGLAVSLEGSIGEMTSAIETQMAAMTEEMAASMAEMRAASAETGVSLSGLVIPALAAAAALGEVVKVSAGFDQALRDVSAVNQLSQQQFEEMHDSILKLTDDPLIRQGPEELAKGMYRIASGGYEGKAGLEVLKVAAEGASAGMTDTQTSSLALIAVLKGYPQGMYTARQAMDLLVGEVDIGVNTFKELASQIGKVVPQAAIMHVRFETVAAAIAVMTRHGVSAAQAMTSINELMVKIQEPGTQAAKIMDKLGIAHGTAAFAAKGFGGWLADTGKKLAHGGKDAADLFREVRALKGMLILGADGAQELTAATEKMNGKTKDGGATARVAAEQAKGLNAQFDKLKQNAAQAAISLGDTLKPVLIDVIKLANGAVTAFKNMLEAFKVSPAPEGQTNIMGGEVNTLQRKRFLLTEIKNLQHSINDAKRLGDTTGIVISDAVIQRNKDQLEQFRAELALLSKPYGPPRSMFGKPNKVDGGFDPFPAHSDSGDGKADREADRRAKEADDAAEKLKELLGRGFNANHSDYENALKDAMDKYQEDSQTAGGSQKGKQAAIDVYNAAVMKAYQEREDAAAEELKKQRDAAEEMVRLFEDAWKEMADDDKEQQKERKERERDALKTWLEDLKERGERDKEALKEAADAAREAAREKADADRDAADRDREIEDNQLEYNRAHGYIDLANYLIILRKKLEGLRAYSNEWMQIQKEIEEAQKEAQKPKKAQGGWKEMLTGMRDQAKSILVDSLGNALMHGFKGFFNSILQGFEEMLAQMLAKAIVSGIFSMLGLGVGGAGMTGGFGGGFLGSLFGGGRGVMPAAGGGGRGVVVNVHMHGDNHFSSGMDAQSVGSAIAWHAQNRLAVVRSQKR